MADTRALDTQVEGDSLAVAMEEVEVDAEGEMVEVVEVEEEAVR